MSKVKLQELLTEQLGLEEALFKLERIGAKWAGSIISESFRGKDDRQRQRMLWAALDAELGAESVHKVGTLLAYTPDEWNVDLSDVPKAKAV